MKTKRFIFIAAISVLMTVLISGAAAPTVRADDGCNAPSFICESNYGHFPTEACNEMAHAYSGDPSYLGCWDAGYGGCMQMYSTPDNWGCWETGDGQAYLYHR